MNQPTQTQTTHAQSTQQPLAESTELMRQTSQVPFTQLLGFQRAMAEMFRSGIDMTNWARTETLSLTKQGLDNYIELLEQTAGGTEEIAQAGVEEIEERAQIPQNWDQQAQNETSQAGQQGRQSSETQPMQANSTPAQQSQYNRQQQGATQQGTYHYAGQQPQYQQPVQAGQPTQQFGQQPIQSGQSAHAQQPGQQFAQQPTQAVQSTYAQQPAHQLSAAQPLQQPAHQFGQSAQQSVQQPGQSTRQPVQQQPRRSTARSHEQREPEQSANGPTSIGSETQMTERPPQPSQ